MFNKRRLAPDLPRRNEESGFWRRRTAEDQLHTVIFKSVTTSNCEVAMGPMRRKLVWVERANFQGWGCTDCAWVFRASRPLVGKTIDEMKTKFGEERDEEFSSHICAEYPRGTEDPD